MLENESTPIMEKIASLKNLSPCQRRRLNRLKQIFRRENRIPPETSLQEMKYLFGLESRRRYYQRKRHLFPFTQRRTPEKRKELKELWESLESAYPPWFEEEPLSETEQDETFDPPWETFEEDLEPLPEGRHEQNEVSEK